jgi:hypothetical protein
MNSITCANISDDASLKNVGKHFNDSTRPRGIFELIVRDSRGKIKEVRLAKNLVTNAGFAGIASRINGAGAEAAGTYLAVGTGTNAANATDTTLQTEITDSGLARVAATASRVTTTVTDDTAQLLTTYTVTGTKAVTEAGYLNASSAGVLFARSVFSAVNVVNGDSLQLTYKIKVA